MDGSVRRFLPRNDIYCKTIPVDTASLKPDPHFSGNQVPIICHAPNHRHVKGTQFLLDALGILREVGFQFELRVVERVARPEAIELYKTSDIIADQFIMGAYGVFALECLALGKPVMTYLDHDALCSPVFNLPILNTIDGICLRCSLLCSMSRSYDIGSDRPEEMRSSDTSLSKPSESFTKFFTIMCGGDYH